MGRMMTLEAKEMRKKSISRTERVVFCCSGWTHPQLSQGGSWLAVISQTYTACLGCLCCILWHWGLGG